MIKKKLKDLSKEEVEKICNKYDSCNECPLIIPSCSYYHCMKNMIEANKEFLDKEVEVEEE